MLVNGATLEEVEAVIADAIPPGIHQSSSSGQSGPSGRTANVPPGPPVAVLPQTSSPTSLGTRITLAFGSGCWAALWNAVVSFSPCTSNT
jgi:hypothetical protein